MIEQFSVEELMKLHDFYRSHECNCDGYHTIVYRKAGYELRYRKYNNPVFKMSVDRKLLKPWTSILHLQTYLKSLFDVAV